MFDLKKKSFIVVFVLHVTGIQNLFKLEIEMLQFLFK